MKKNHNTYYERTNPIETCTKGRSKHLMKLLYLFAICCIIFLQIAASALIQKNCWWRSELIRPFTNEPQMIERNNISKNFSQFNIRRKEKKRELFFPNFTSISFSPLCDMKRKKFEDRTTPFPSKRKDWSPDCTLWSTIFLQSRIRLKRDWSWIDSKKNTVWFLPEELIFCKNAAQYDHAKSVRGERSWLAGLHRSHFPRAWLLSPAPYSQIAALFDIAPLSQANVSWTW